MKLLGRIKLSGGIEMKMKLTKTKPKSGQFVAVWEFNKKIWCDTFMWEDGIFKLYIHSTDEFEVDDWADGFPYTNQTNIHYYQLEE